ncbi:GNAT family N-acetyltransferase [Fulvivirga sp. M361]|uniref:arsenic resistance N-acetyltransferase ArsN2 n=1 Tax=Fulvivirga sp. M361 TaxID=2594266 RepID=UPI00117A4E98|nr:arsenic resistance N-acetyltransferase ArsN2 [Fulvivirga sp. M361]TRX52185.1 GNAT family N-acetyltransferase [Fulvivirga sp. M361]
MNNIIVLDHNYTDEVLAILKQSKLPTEDVDLEKQLFIGYQSEERLTGIGALEIFGKNALLRSMAVVYSSQNRGLGSKLVSRLIQEADLRQVKNIYLLTETAQTFFEKHDFIQTARNEVPEIILQSAEFKKLCPTTAICMQYFMNHK